MSKRAFSIIEIAIVIFLILMVASIFIPMNIANVKQAERIVKWKNTFEETKYSFEVLKANNQNLFETIKFNKINSSKSAFDVFKPYLNINYEKSTKDYFKGYRYKFLNGTRVKKKSNFYVTDFATLKSGVIIGFKLNKSRGMYSNATIGTMLFDINGINKPNRIGKDVFFINIYPNEIKAVGEDRSLSVLRANCSPIGTGTFCSKYYLIGGNF